MVNATVEKATSDMLIGPDWAMNIEICDVCNNDPAHSKDVVKGIKKRLGSRNPKVQLLALTLLETIVKNCGDIVHMHVAEKDVPHEMVKIFKKKPDFHVKEKILILIDTWQEAFGGPRAKYPQYYAAYQELLRNGAAFPQRSDRSAPVFTPPQTQPLASYPQNLRNTDSIPDAPESSAEAEFPTLSLTEIQNAHGIMDVLAEMLNALDPGNKEGLKQEVIVDLVEQCRNYKQRVVHLVNSTSDESLLCEGLALNDDLQKVLAKHESIVSGTALKTPQALPVPVQTVARDHAPLIDTPLIDTGDSNKSEQGSTSSTLGSQLALPAPPTTNGPQSTPTKASPKIDLLSGDDYNSPTAENSLALVPVNVGEPHPVNDVSQQNALALVDMYAPSNSAQYTHSVGQSYPSPPQFQQQTNFQRPHSPLQPNGSGAMIPQYEQSFYTQGPNTNWSSPMAQQQQPSSTIYGGGGQTSGSLPPPPWEEVQPAETAPYSGVYAPQQLITHSQPLPNGTYHPQASMGMYVQPVHGGAQATMNPQVLQNNQFVGFQPQPMQMGPSMGMYPQSAYMYPQQQMYVNQVGDYGYGYGQQQQQSSQFLEQRMSGLSVRDNGVLGGNSSYVGGSTPSYVHAPSGKPSKQDDKFFGDLVDMSKFKPTKTAGSSGTV